MAAGRDRACGDGFLGVSDVVLGVFSAIHDSGNGNSGALGARFGNRSWVRISNFCRRVCNAQARLHGKARSADEYAHADLCVSFAHADRADDRYSLAVHKQYALGEFYAEFDPVMGCVSFQHSGVCLVHLHLVPDPAVYPHSPGSGRDRICASHHDRDRLLSFLDELSSVLRNFSDLFLPAVFVWFALRLHIRWMTLGIFITSLIAISGTIIAHPSVLPINVVLLTDEVYIGLVAAISLVFAAVVGERRTAFSALAENNKSLQEALEKISSED